MDWSLPERGKLAFYPPFSFFSVQSEMADMDVFQDLRTVRNQICDWVLVTCAIVGVPAALASLSRVYTIGWHWIIAIHCACAVLLVFLAVYRRSVAFHLRAGFLIGAGIFIGLTGMMKFGLVSTSLPFLFAAPALATILFGCRTGICLALVTILGMSSVAFAIASGSIATNFDIETYLRLPPAWINYVLVAVLAISSPIVAIYMLEQHLLKALREAKRGRDELELRVQERTRELEAAKQAAERLARVDGLTGLYNRRAFLEYARLVDEQARRHTIPYVILMIDIDFFKAVNDKWGHVGGDAVLRLFGYIAKRMFRSSDVLGRIGGEEFAILLTNTDLQEGLALAEKLRRKAMGVGVHAPAGEIAFTISVGVALQDDFSTPMERVLADADAALYRAKETGRNRVEYFEGSGFKQPVDQKSRRCKPAS